jgi:hypothetical protein
MEIKTESRFLTSSMKDAVRYNFFPTKKETAEHYKDYIYFTDLPAWYVPRNPNSRETQEIIRKMKLYYGEDSSLNK